MTPTPTAARVSGTINQTSDLDAEYERALGIMLRANRVSTSFVSRAMGIGYNAAARLVERAEADGIVTRPNEVGKRSLAAIQPDPEPKPVARVEDLAMLIGMLARHVPDDKQIKAKALDYLHRHGLQGSPLRDTATPSSAGTVSVEAAARVLLDACPNPIFDQLKPVLMGEVTERVSYTDEDGNEDYYDRPVSWDAMKTIISTALRAIAGEGGR